MGGGEGRPVAFREFSLRQKHSGPPWPKGSVVRVSRWKLCFFAKMLFLALFSWVSKHGNIYAKK
jgi:hypothetical protein